MMSNSQTRQNHKSDQSNANKGTPGQNQTHSKVHGNRGAQKNPNRKES